jgi:hypothetical protein
MNCHRDARLGCRQSVWNMHVFKMLYRNVLGNVFKILHIIATYQKKDTTHNS